ncbi:hypothetical protein AAKU67_002261 [Oxalobacteraceae bacterium GrIS 2.11]
MSDAEAVAEKIILPNKVLLWSWRSAIGLLVFILLALAWLVAFGNVYTSGSKLGYNLGLAGGLMMLTLLLYPLRKRIRVLARLGRMETWFRYHMFMGIGGPVLILFHSTFKIGSTNSSIALYSMLLVALSGVIGRFVYRRIHSGLYGKEVTLASAEGQLNASLQSIHSVYSLSPQIEHELRDFQEYASAQQPNLQARVWRFMTLRHQGKVLTRKVNQEIKKTLASQAKKNGWSKSQLRMNYVIARRQMNDYVNAIIQYSQLSHWLKLFSLWHIAHVPFVYLLVFCGFAHVIAVHLY